MSAFVAHSDIEPTLEWQDEIEAALASCDAMLVLLHPRFHESKWTDQEIGYGMGRQLLIVAARLGADPYGFIARFQGMNGNGKTAPTLARELFGILRQHEKTRKGISEAVAARFCQSNSFGSARENMKLLETLAHWDSSLSERVLSASTANRQIADAVWQWNPEVPLRNRLSQFLAGRENS